MSKKHMLAGALISASIILSGCFGGSGEIAEDKEFDADSIVTREDKEDLDNKYASIMGSESEDIKSSDYVIKQIMSVDLDKDYFYGGILSMDIDEIYQQQLKYYEVHREYMKYLYEKGADEDELILNNRKFNFYLETFKGRHLEGKDHVKRFLEKLFYKYNVLELEAILEGESLVEFIDSERKSEEESGLWDWLRDSENVGFKGNILEFTKVTFDLLEPSDKDVVEKYVKYIKEIEELLVSKIPDDDKYNKLEGYLDKVDKERVNDDVDWIKIKVKNYIVYEMNKIHLKGKGNEFDLAEDEFYVSIETQEVLVTLNMFEEELSKQSEKRKKLKEEIENSEK